MQDQDHAHNSANLEAKLQKAQDFFETANYAAAEPLYRNVLAEIGNQESAVQVLINLSRIHKSQGNYKEAIRLNLRLLSLVQSLHGESSEQAVTTITDLAGLYELEDRWHEAGDLHYRANVMREKLIWGERAEPVVNDVPEERQSSGSASALPTVSSKPPGGHDRDNSLLRTKGSMSIPEPDHAEQFDTGQLRALVHEQKKLNAPLRKTSLRQSLQRKSGPEEQIESVPETRSDRSSAGEEVWRETIFPSPQFNFIEQLQRVLFPLALSKRRHDQSDSKSSQPSSESRSARSFRGLQVDRADQRLRASAATDQVSVTRLMFKASVALQDRSNKYIAAGGAFLLLIFALINLLLQPKLVDPFEEYLTMPHRYHTIEDTRHLDFTKANSCTFTMDNDQREMPVRYYLGDWREACEMAFRSLFERQHWLLKQHDGLKEIGGLMYYATSGSVGGLVKEALALATAANQWYYKHGAYPIELEPLIVSPYDGRYANPFQSAVDQPQFVETSTLDTQASLNSGHVLMNEMYARLKSGAFLTVTPELHPGSIVWNNIVVPCDNSSINSMVIRIANADGRFISGEKPGTVFMLILENGKTFRANQGREGVLSQEAAYIIDHPRSSEIVLALCRAFPCVLFSFSAVLIMASVPFLRLSTKGNLIRLLIALISLCTSIAYCWRSYLPP